MQWVRLLDRSEHGVLTPYGQALINRGISAFDELRKDSGISDFVRPDSRRVIGCPEAIASGALGAVLATGRRQTI
jgi:DNA-binding transcriptional LysR family regulator